MFVGAGASLVLALLALELHELAVAVVSVNHHDLLLVGVQRVLASGDHAVRNRRDLVRSGHGSPHKSCSLKRVGINEQYGCKQHAL